MQVLNESRTFYKKKKDPKHSIEDLPFYYDPGERTQKMALCEGKGLKAKPLPILEKAKSEGKMGSQPVL